MAASLELVTPHHSFVGTIQLTLVSWMKVERDEELITILNDDPDGNLLLGAPQNRSSLVNYSLQDSFERTHIPISRPPLHVGLQKSLSVVDSLKRIRATKEARNVFKILDFDSLDI